MSAEVPMTYKHRIFLKFGEVKKIFTVKRINRLQLIKYQLPKFTASVKTNRCSMFITITSKFIL